jgi:hypothetical protein
MLSKIKKYFFAVVFGLLYLSFVVQFAYAVVGLIESKFADGQMAALGLLSFEWLALMAARNLSKKSGNSQARAHGNGGGNGYNHRRY